MASHYNDTGINNGNSRNPGDVSSSVKEIVKQQIINTAEKANLSETDIANLLAIAEHESGFNPDAASKTTSASGVFQILDSTAKDAINRLNGTGLVNSYTFSGNYDRFDIDSNIKVGIAVYLDKKRIAGSDDIREIYQYYNPHASDNLLNKMNILFNKYNLQKHSLIDIDFDNITYDDIDKIAKLVIPDSYTQLAELDSDVYDSSVLSAFQATDDQQSIGNTILKIINNNELSSIIEVNYVEGHHITITFSNGNSYTINRSTPAESTLTQVAVPASPITNYFSVTTNPDLTTTTGASDPTQSVSANNSTLISTGTSTVTGVGNVNTATGVYAYANNLLTDGYRPGNNNFAQEITDSQLAETFRANPDAASYQCWKPEGCRRYP